MAMPGNPERGAALLLLLTLVVLGGAALFAAAHPKNGARLTARQEVTAALRTAKEELIAFTVNYDQLYPASSTGPGHFPCPDADGNGTPDTPCGPDAIGWLPRTTPSASRRLWFGDHGLGNGRRIWYAVADGFRDNPPGLNVNSNSAGTLTINGTAGAIAVLIEPGEPDNRQERPGSGYLDYLEGTDPTAQRYDSAGNDQLLAIYPREVFPLINARVATELVAAVRRYRSDCGYYPAPVAFADPETLSSFDSDTGGTVTEGLFPAGTAFPADWGTGCAPTLALPAWLVGNGWHRHVYYAVAPSDPCIPGAGCLTVSGGPAPGNDKQALLVLPGIALAGRNRSAAGAGRADYFEGENATAGDGVFAAGPLGTDFNDQVFVIN